MKSKRGGGRKERIVLEGEKRGKGEQRSVRGKYRVTKERGTERGE